MTPQPNRTDASGRITPEKPSVRPLERLTPAAGPGVHPAPRSAPDGPTHRHDHGEGVVTAEIRSFSFGGGAAVDGRSDPRR